MKDDTVKVKVGVSDAYMDVSIVQNRVCDDKIKPCEHCLFVNGKWVMPVAIDAYAGNHSSCVFCLKCFLEQVQNNGR